MPPPLPPCLPLAPVYSRSVRRLFDKNILFHKWCAYTICFFAAIHIVAHVFNITRLCESKNGNAAKLILNNDTPITVLFTHLPGYTGIMITVSLIMMVTTAVDQIRRYVHFGPVSARRAPLRPVCFRPCRSVPATC